MLRKISSFLFFHRSVVLPVQTHSEIFKYACIYVFKWRAYMFLHILTWWILTRKTIMTIADKLTCYGFEFTVVLRDGLPNTARDPSLDWNLIHSCIATIDITISAMTAAEVMYDLCKTITIHNYNATKARDKQMWNIRISPQADVTSEISSS